jgi:hypothetical protein
MKQQQQQQRLLQQQRLIAAAKMGLNPNLSISPINSKSNVSPIGSKTSQPARPQIAQPQRPQSMAVDLSLGKSLLKTTAQQSTANR